MGHQTANSDRFVVQEHGPRDFSVYDSVTGLSYDPRFTRKAAEDDAARRNKRTAPAS
jgi:hypothetical protein